MSDRRSRRPTARALAALLLLFAISVAVRVPNLGRPLGRQHEWNTAQVLRLFEIWRSEGLWEAKGLAVMTYPGRANRFIYNNARVMSRDGVGYYTSFPATGFVVPYLIFAVLHVRPTLWSLEAFSMAVHLITVLMLWILVRYLVRDRPAPAREGIPLAVAALYAFAPIAMWMLTNVYFTHMLAPPFLIASVYAAVRAWPGSREVRGWTTVLVALLFLTTLIDWIGAFFALAVAASYAIRRPRRWGLVTLVALAPCVAFGLHVAHISLIPTDRSLATAVLAPAGRRIGLGGRGVGAAFLRPIDWARILGYYVVGYASFAFFGFAAIVASRAARRPAAPAATITDDWRAATVLPLGAIAVFHLMFFNYSAIHSFSVLHGVPLVGAAVAWLAIRLRPKALVAVSVLAVLAGVGAYAVWFSRSIPPYRKIGRTIAERARPDEVVFLVGARTPDDPHPAVVYYAHRNIAQWKGKRAARALIARNDAADGIVFAFDQSGDLVSERRIEP